MSVYVNCQIWNLFKMLSSPLQISTGIRTATNIIKLYEMLCWCAIYGYNTVITLGLRHYC